MGGCKKRKWSSHLINYPKLNKLIPFHCCSHVGHNLNIDYSCGHTQRFWPADKLCETAIQEWHWGLLSGDSVLGLACSALWHWRIQVNKIGNKGDKKYLHMPAFKEMRGVTLATHGCCRSNIGPSHKNPETSIRLNWVFGHWPVKQLVIAHNGKNIQRGVFCIMCGYLPMLITWNQFN